MASSKMSPLPLPEGKSTHVFLSHARRANHAAVVAMSKLLEEMGFMVWLDDEDIAGDVVAQMCAGIEKTCIFIACVSMLYIDKCAGKGDLGQGDHCKREFDYAVLELGPEKMLAVVTDKSFLDLKKWHGSVKFSLGSRLFMDLTAHEDDAAFNVQVQSIAAQLRKMLSASYGLVGKEGTKVEPGNIVLTNFEPQIS